MITTGPAPLPDIGQLSYNGVQFNSLYRSEFNAKPLQDKAGRTIKYVEATLDVEATVTLPAGAKDLDPSALQIRQLLEQQGGVLIYTGNGTGGLVVNTKQNPDVAWGPVPKLVSFKPLGQGRSAEVHWQVTTWILDIPSMPLLGVLELNFESSVSFDDEGYSIVSFKGTLEVPFNRPSPDIRAMQLTVDNFRETWLNIQIDLTQFRPTRRVFQTSRDKRTIEWEFAAEELPPMGLPKYASKARGTMSVRPIRNASGRGFPQATAMWTCTLKATYTIRKDFRADTALLLFYALLWFRMRSSQNGLFPPITAGPANANQQRPNAGGGIFSGIVDAIASSGGAVGSNISFQQQFQQQGQQQQPGTLPASSFKKILASGRAQPGSAILTDFGFDEGLHLDSKTITFDATWMLLTSFQTLMRASGVWRWGPETAGTIGGNTTWSAKMQDMMGWRSWMQNQLDPAMAYIVDMNTGREPYAGPLMKRE